MTIDILISCMHQKDWSIIERSKLQGGAVIVNQCDYHAKLGQKSSSSIMGWYIHWGNA